MDNLGCFREQIKFLDNKHKSKASAATGAARDKGLHCLHASLQLEQLGHCLIFLEMLPTRALGEDPADGLCSMWHPERGLSAPLGRSWCSSGKRSEPLPSCSPPILQGPCPLPALAAGHHEAPLELLHPHSQSVFYEAPAFEASPQGSSTLGSGMLFGSSSPPSREMSILCFSP